LQVIRDSPSRLCI